MLSKLRAQSVLSWLLYLVVVLAAVPVQARRTVSGLEMYRGP